MSLLGRLYNWMPGQPIVSAEANAELNQIVNTFNGTLTNKNLLVRFSDVAVPTLDLDQLNTGLIQRWKSSGVAVAQVNASGQFQSLVATGTAPMIVASTTSVANLNADLVDGLHGSQFVRNDGAGGDTVMTGQLKISNTVPNLKLEDTDQAGGKTTEFNFNGDVLQIIDLTDGGTPFQINMSSHVATFSQIPVGPGSDPTTGNQLARKAYVDQFLPLAGGSISGNLSVGGNLTVSGALNLNGGVTVLNQQQGSISVSGSSETDFHSFTIPGGTLANDGDFLILITSGGYDSDNSNKTIRWYLNGSSFDSFQGTSDREYNSYLVIYRTSSSTAYFMRFLSGQVERNVARTNGSGVVIGQFTCEVTDSNKGTIGSLNWGSSMVFKTTGQGNASNRLNEEMMIILKGNGV